MTALEVFWVEDFFFYLKRIMCMNVFPGFVYVHHMCVYPQKSDEDIDSLGTEVVVSHMDAKN